MNNKLWKSESVIIPFLAIILLTAGTTALFVEAFNKEMPYSAFFFITGSLVYILVLVIANQLVKDLIASGGINAILHEHDMAKAPNISPNIQNRTFIGVVVEQKEFFPLTPKETDTRYTVKTIKFKENCFLYFYDFGREAYHTNFCAVVQIYENGTTDFQVFEKAK